MSNAKNLKNKQSDTKKISFKELSLIKDMIFWVDIVSNEQNDKNAIFARPFNDKNAIPQQLTGKLSILSKGFSAYLWGQADRGWQESSNE